MLTSKLFNNAGIWFGLGQTAAFSVTGADGILSPEAIATSTATALGVLPLFLSDKKIDQISLVIPSFKENNWALYVNGITLPAFVAPMSLLYSGSATGALIAAGFGIGNALKAMEIDGKWKRENIRNFLSSTFSLKSDVRKLSSNNEHDLSDKVSKVSQNLRNFGDNVLNNLGLPELYTAVGSIAAASLGSPQTQWFTIPSAGLALAFTATAKPAGNQKPSHSILYGSRKVQGLSDQVFARACFLLNNAAGSIAALLNSDVTGFNQNVTALSGGLLATGNALLLRLGIKADIAATPRPV